MRQGCAYLDHLDTYKMVAYIFKSYRWGHSSAGRALQWHCRGRRFDPAWLHHYLRGWLASLLFFYICLLILV